MKNIMFAGIKGKVIESSPHNNYLVVELSDRVTIIGTFSNQFSWKEMPEISSGFESFITYIGVRSLSESKKVKEIVTSSGGYFHKNEQEPRSSKRVKGFPLELKVRGLSVDFCVALIVKKDL